MIIKKKSNAAHDEGRRMMPLSSIFEIKNCTYASRILNNYIIQLNLDKWDLDKWESLDKWEISLNFFSVLCHFWINGTFSKLEMLDKWDDFCRKMAFFDRKMAVFDRKMAIFGYFSLKTSKYRSAASLLA